ncbi:MAG: ROK family protein [Xanthobacteraceae bacterium]
MLNPELAAKTPVLAADLGGTTTRFALAYPGEPLRHMSVIVNDTAPTLEAAIERYVREVGVRPPAAVLAVAGPILGDEVALTHRAWRFRLSELKAKFGFARAEVLNDFEALAWALTGIRPCDTRPIGPGTQATPAVKAAVGPGTGLGVAGLVPLAAGGWHVIASEGGHVSFGPATAAEEAVFDRLREEAPIAAETLLSGPGIERLHRALHAGATPLQSHEIVRRAHTGDPAARASVDLFVGLLGRFAGDVALMFKATGGVYIAGGVAQGLSTILDAVIFRAAFEAHPPYQQLMAGIPTFLVTCPEPGLIGCAAYAEQEI